MNARFYYDPATGYPHIHGHGVCEDEVMDIFIYIYVPDWELDSVFVITAYDLAGQALAAFRRRRRKKQQ